MPNIQLRLVIFTNMKKSSYQVIGVMSGTSLDGIDIALIQFDKEGKWNFRILAAETLAYPEKWRKLLSTAIDLQNDELEQLNFHYTTYLGETINQFLKKHEVDAIDAVCSHGHTVKHEPHKGFTLQIGNMKELSQILQEVVICDFRVQDVLLGGQGAPLVPVGDELLFSKFKYCLNLGGFANISTVRDGRRIAYDICPVNTVLNFYAGKLGKEYDESGGVARSGSLDQELLQKLDAISFYHLPPPKSLGLEFVNSEIFPVLQKSGNKTADILRTFTEHISFQILKNLDDNPASEVLVTGGGAYNTFLIEQIKEKSKTRLVIPSEVIVNYKEALIFGLLGVLKLRGEVNVLKSVTGASIDHSSGVIFEP